MWAEAAVTIASASRPASASAVRTRGVRPPIRGSSLLAAWPMCHCLLLVLQGGKRRGHPGDRHAVGRAAHVVEPGQLEERDRVRVAPVLAADPELQVRLGL